MKATSLKEVLISKVKKKIEEISRCKFITQLLKIILLIEQIKKKYKLIERIKIILIIYRCIQNIISIYNFITH